MQKLTDELSDVSRKLKFLQDEKNQLLSKSSNEAQQKSLEVQALEQVNRGLLTVKSSGRAIDKVPITTLVAHFHCKYLLKFLVKFDRRQYRNLFIIISLFIIYSQSSNPRKWCDNILDFLIFMYFTELLYGVQNLCQIFLNSDINLPI